MENKELFELTNPQKSIWYTEQFYEGTTVNNICVSGTLYGKINEDILKQAINNVVLQNDSFRIHVIIKNNIPKQYISDYKKFDIDVEYINSESEIKQIEKNEAKFKFNIDDSDLFRFKLAICKGNFACIILTVNHLIADSWSLGLVIQEILKNYNALINNEKYVPDTFSYLEYINSENEYKNSKKFKNDKLFWNQTFSTIPEQATIPCSINSAKSASYNAKRLGFELDKEIVSKINSFCRENGISTFNFFMAVFSIYIGRVSNINDFVIGTPILNRSNFKEKHTTGMFISTVPVRFNNINKGSFKELANSVATKLMGILRHQKYSYNAILEDIRKENGNIPNLYNITISYQITKAFDSSLGNYKTDWIFNNYCANDFNIHIYDINDTGNLLIDYDFLVDKYTKDDVVNINNRIIYMIGQILDNSNINSRDIEIITPEEKNKVINVFNDTAIEYSKNKTIVDLFEEQVKKTPDSIAIVSNGKKITYKDLNAKANQLANYLNSSNVKSGDIVGIMTNRSIEMIIGLIAILKSGAAYLPIDPDYPLQRISYMLDNSKSKIILVNNQTSDLIEENYKKINISLEQDLYKADSKKENLNIKISPEQLMYLIYTSGSTGNPKGVMISHKNVHNFIVGMKQNIDFNPNKTMVSLTTICFDIFGLELWCSLTNGLKVVIANEFEQKDASAFNRLCLNNDVSMIQTTPSRFLAFLEDSSCLEYLKNMTDILIGGESLPENLLVKLKHLSNANIYNMYGPTETTIWSTMKNLTKNSNITIGKPIANTQCYILDPNQKILPPYVVGNLYIGGDGVSSGYFGRPDLTSEKFIKYIDNNVIYNTNDLAYYTYNGEIVHLGRADFQVKMHGYRIELGEIENTISVFDNITSCAVGCPTLNNKKILCAYYTSSEEININDLKAHLLKSLPTYMIPSHFVNMEKLPHTPNGKIDRKALDAVTLEVDKNVVLPKNEIEKKVFDIISKISNNSNISMDDDLFSIGLDSIGIIHLSAKIEQIFGITTSIRDLYNTHSLIDLANLITSSNQSGLGHIEKTVKKSYYPLSSSQKSMFYAAQMDKDSTVYNVSCGFLTDTILDANKVKSSFEKIIKLQSSFRTSFSIIDGIACQVVLDDVPFDIEINYDTEANKQNILDNFAKPFDLSNAPLLRVSVYYLDNEKTMILIDSHHIVMDGSSLYIMMDEFCKLYQDKDIKPLNIEYIDYAVSEDDFINSDKISDIENYWLSKINTKELPILNLPYDYAVSNVKSFNGSSVDFCVDSSIFKKVNNIAKKYRVSPFTFFISVFYIVLYKYTGQSDIIVGTPVDSRMYSELNNMIGMFVNNTLLRNKINSSSEFSNFLFETQDLIKEALSNQPYPYNELISKLNSPANSLLDVVFTYQTPHDKKFKIDDYSFNIVRPNTSTSKFNLLLEVVPDMNVIRVEYNTDLFKYQTAESILKHYLFVLNSLINNQEQVISDINIITDEEKNMLNEFNNTAGPINSDTVVSIFEEQVEKNPNNIALICDDVSLTYNELNEKANSLAHYLINKGIGRNDKVCIMTNRSLETIVCMLGISKAGAAFFNVDPTYPIERTKYYLEDSQTKYVLTQKSLRERVESIENCIEIDLSNDEIYGKIYDNPNVTVLPEDLSYVIYTSGSTGTPKGVMLNQVGFANMTKAMTKVLDYLKEGNKHTIVSVTSTPFDIFVYEIIVSLTHGLKVVMANNAEHRNPKLLDALIKKYNVDVMTVTPSLMKINYDNREPDTALALVKNMVFGGEPLPEKFVKDLRALADDITIYNIYGPSEITVLSNVQNLDGETEITVGPPIMNTQIHILDKNMNQVPIGVIGEIYISGIQVGLGYIGKPEMTASRFMDNPFGPGKIYKSGDIGRWTFDGKVQCLGRVDNQIKLRGLRIELGEIENIMANVPGVSASVVNKIEMDGKEVLCGYYVANSSVLPDTVKLTLKKALPPYMVPSYVIRLDKMPYTINRKIDRKSLPLPSLHRSISTKTVNIDELNTNEEKLLQIWKNILKVDDITVNDNFFDIGGDSIGAIQMQIEAIKYGLKFEYADIFNYPTIKELSNKLPSSEINFIEDYDYDKINSVLARNTLDNLSSIVPATIDNILLIGTTGYLGAHIIDEFMKQNSGIIYCLTRPKNNVDPTSRLKQTLNFYFGDKYSNQFSKRIRVVEGDISKEGLGLSTSDYDLIRNNIDVVINSGAIVKHYGLKGQFDDINVLGTQNVVDFCKKENKRLLHISTMSVSGSGEKEEAIEETPENINFKKQFSETNLFVGQKLKGVYTTTKYKAELIVLEAIYDGLNAQILRLGNITNRYSDGVFQQNVDNNAFAKRIKSFIEIGAVPKYMLKHAIELTPVDLAAEAIVKIMNHDSNCNVFHIYNTKLMTIKLLLETLDSLGHEIIPMSDEMFAYLITGILSDNEKKKCLSGIIYDLDESKKLTYTYNVRLHANFTDEYLKRVSFSWKDIDADYIIRYMKYFEKIGFIPGGDTNE